jgi:hypothetical protein
MKEKHKTKKKVISDKPCQEILEVRLYSTEKENVVLDLCPGFGDLVEVSLLVFPKATP